MSVQWAAESSKRNRKEVNNDLKDFRAQLLAKTSTEINAMNISKKRKEILINEERKFLLEVFPPCV